MLATGDVLIEPLFHPMVGLEKRLEKPKIHHKLNMTKRQLPVAIYNRTPRHAERQQSSGSEERGRTSRVQGALLSTVMHPILPHSVFFGSMAPVSDQSLMHALFGRIEPPAIPCNVESIRNKIVLSISPSHVWTRDMEHVEMLNVESGRTNKGSPSRLCKAAIFEAFLKLAPEGMKCSTYMEAKQKAVAYGEAKRVLYEQMEAAGLGRWQTKPVKLVDFSLDSYDA
ncbi:unnamed protein product [Heligmosomoides polygyrus]|uniref:A to I editase domain-containing protein n=1 Tax=Heligmosomoides polygyrus TaxID=6339 RepID=A0A183FDV5_HELPZ|nr:unnamed protein product [Heligmosomoides polygyrus]